METQKELKVCTNTITIRRPGCRLGDQSTFFRFFSSGVAFRGKAILKKVAWSPFPSPWSFEGDLIVIGLSGSKNRDNISHSYVVTVVSYLSSKGGKMGSAT